MRPSSRNGRPARYLAVVVLLALMFVAPSHGAAWADTTGTDSRDSSVSRSESTTDGTDSSSTAAASESGTAADDPDTSPAAEPSVDDDPTAGTDGVDDDDAPADGDDSASPEPEPEPEPQPEPESEPASASTPTGDSAEPTTSHPSADSDSAATAVVVRAAAPASNDDAETAPPAEPASPDDNDVTPAVTTLVALTEPTPTAAATSSTAVVETEPITPRRLSPIAEIVALPGRIINTVLQLVGITTAMGQWPTPITPAPIAELLFAVFRRLEELAGLDEPVALPVPPSLVYDGPLDIPTPTVAQFLNAATTEYVLGGAPGGLAAFVVDGWQMTSLHLETGSDASVWVTPQNQIIIAYSGTTGGTNLLFNPLIALTQILTDVQAAFSDETPKAFTQAVDFAQRVQAEAALQGYGPDDVFVTGHSLGAWQAQYVAQQLGLNGIGFEGPGLSSTVPGNGADSLFVNTATYGDMAGFLASDLPGLYPLAPPYVPGGGLKPHYGPIVMLGDPDANTPMANAAALFGKGIVGTLIAAVDLFGNFFAKHLPGVQAYHLDVVSDPGVVPWLGINEGPVHTGFGELTIPEFLKAASDAGILVAP